MASRKICKTDRYKGDFRKIKEKEPQKIETKGKTSWSIVWKHSKAAIGRVWSFLKILPQAILLIPKGILYVLYLFFMGNFPSEKDTTPLTAKIFIRRFFIVIDNIIAPVLFFISHLGCIALWRTSHRHSVPYGMIIVWDQLMVA